MDQSLRKQKSSVNQILQKQKSSVKSVHETLQRQKSSVQSENDLIAEMVVDIFDSFDVDKNGTIDRKEAIALVNSMREANGQYPATHQQFNQQFNEVDANGDGVLEKKEMIKVVRNLLEIKDREQPQVIKIVNQIWKEFDQDGNGKLNRVETLRFVNTFFRSQGKPEVKNAQFDALFKKFDLNGDGFISKMEMARFVVQFMTKKAEEAENVRKRTSEEQKEEDTNITRMVKKIFSKYDKDNSGELERKESLKLINDVFKSVGKRPVTHALFNQIFTEFDVNGDGVLSEAEMSQFVIKYINELEEQALMDEYIDKEVKKIFQKYDKRKRGKLERKESQLLVKDIFKQEGKQQPSNIAFNRIFNEFDVDGDGVLTPEEMTQFVVKFMKLPEKKQSSMSQGTLPQVDKQELEEVSLKIKNQISEKGCDQTLALELKRRDFNNFGFLPEKEIQKVLNKVKVQVDQKDFELLIQSAEKDEDMHSYKDILKQVLPDGDKSQKLIESNLSELEEQEQTKFKVPIAIEEPLTKNLGLIGQDLIKKQVDYEQILQEKSEDKQDPQVTHEQIKTSLKQMGVKMNKDIQEDLNQYCVNHQENQKIPLANFLKDIGLPPQTVGDQPLTARQLQKCHSLIKELDTELKNKNKDLFQMKRDAQKMQAITGQGDNLQEVNPDDFIQQVYSLGSNQIAKKLEKEKATVTAYLSEQSKDKITWSKLAKALAQKKPIPQTLVVTEEEIMQEQMNELWKKYDKDQDDIINHEEAFKITKDFLKIQKKQEPTKNQFQPFIQKFEVKQDGYIQKYEQKRFMKAILEEKFPKEKLINIEEPNLAKNRSVMFEDQSELKSDPALSHQDSEKFPFNKSIAASPPVIQTPLQQTFGKNSPEKQVTIFEPRPGRNEVQNLLNPSPLDQEPPGANQEVDMQVQQINTRPQSKVEEIIPENTISVPSSHSNAKKLENQIQNIPSASMMKIDDEEDQRPQSPKSILKNKTRTSNMIKESGGDQVPMRSREQPTSIIPKNTTKTKNDAKKPKNQKHLEPLEPPQPEKKSKEFINLQADQQLKHDKIQKQHDTKPQKQHKDRKRQEDKQVPQKKKTPSEIEKEQKLQEELDACSLTSEHEMESDIFDFKQIMDEPNFGIKIYKKQNAWYKGLISHNKRNGYGVYKVDEEPGQLYEGEWLNDKRNGLGYQRYKNGNIYRGKFYNNKPHGKGTYTWLSGEIYDGEWVYGCKNGFGIWRGLRKNDQYLGEWRDNKAWGYGVHQWYNGDKYEGEWARGLKNGKGTDYFANQDHFTGQYLDGAPEGQGQYKWKSGACYVGGFSRGMKHGKGSWKKDETNPNGNQYSGEYFNDKKHGQGEFKWESGNRYMGNYKFDKRHGYGEMYWKNGTIYKGDWEQGMQHGFGEITTPDGKTRKGKFENNFFVSAVKDDTKKPVPLPTQEEDEEEVMQSSQFSPSVGAKSIRVKHDMQIQTNPIQKMKAIQTSRLSNLSSFRGLRLKKKGTPKKRGVESQVQTEERPEIGLLTQKMKREENEIEDLERLIREQAQQEMTMTLTQSDDEDMVLLEMPAPIKDKLNKPSANFNQLGEHHKIQVKTKESDQNTMVVMPRGSPLNTELAHIESHTQQEQQPNQNQAYIRASEKILSPLRGQHGMKESLRMSKDPLSPGKPKRNLINLPGQSKRNLMNLPGQSQRNLMIIPPEQRRSHAPKPISKPSHKSIYSPVRSPARPGETYIKSPKSPRSLLRRSPTIVQQPVLSMEIKSQLKHHVEEVTTPPPFEHSEIEEKEESFLPQIESSHQHGRKNQYATIDNEVLSIKSSTVIKQEYTHSDSDSSTTNVDQMRRASKRAITMMMKKMKANQKSNVWVPQGRQISQTKAFHKNLLTRRGFY